MPANAILNIGGDSYDVIRFRYGFRRTVDNKGRPKGGVTGGEIIVELEATDNTALFERLVSRELRSHRGSLEVWDTRENSRSRTLSWDEAYIYSYNESMDARSARPMTFNIAITPLRLDIDSAVSIDRRWPHTHGFWWEEYRAEQSGKIVSSGQDEDKEPEITRVLWKDAEGKETIDDITDDGIVSLYAEVTNGEGEQVTFTIELDDGKEITLSGLVEDGVAVIKGIDINKYKQEGA